MNIVWDDKNEQLTITFPVTGKSELDVSISSTCLFGHAVTSQRGVNPIGKYPFTSYNYVSETIGKWTNSIHVRIAGEDYDEYGVSCFAGIDGDDPVEVRITGSIKNEKFDRVVTIRKNKK